MPKALLIQENRSAAVREIPRQAARNGYLRVKPAAVCVNPTDGDHLAVTGPVGGILGCDFAGVVEEVGQGCTNSSYLKPGDTVYGVCHGANANQLEDGAYAESIMVRDGHLQLIPEGRSFEEVSTLGVGITSVGQLYYLQLNLPTPLEPTKESFPILISGGATATGSIAIQFAKLAGLQVITTTSPKNFDFVKSRDADLVFDYNDTQVGKKINEATHNKLRYAVDCVSTESTLKLVAEALSSDASNGELHLVGLLPVDAFPRKDVNARAILAYTTFGEAFDKFGQSFPPIPDHYEVGVKTWKIAGKLLQEGKLKPHPASFRPGGLQGLFQGIQDVRSGKVSAAKLVYRMADTTEITDEVSEGISQAGRFTGKFDE